MTTIYTRLFLIHRDIKDEFITVKLRGYLADIKSNIPLKMYCKCINYGTKGKSVLYLKCLRSVHGITNTHLLSYLNLVSDTKSNSLKLNLNNPCVVNNTIDTYQIKIVCNLYSINISCMSSRVVDEMIKCKNIMYKKLLTGDARNTEI